MKPERYNTDAPGVGNYRHQTEFGVYSASDTYNHFNIDSFSRTASDKTLTRDFEQTGLTHQSAGFRHLRANKKKNKKVLAVAASRAETAHMLSRES